MAAWTEALKTRDVPTILKISLVEGVAAFVEVLFLYRELVDSLVPWFAQHTAKDSQLQQIRSILHREESVPSALG
jgi:hypothetical protein